MQTPQIIISLSPQGELVTELPGLNGSRRKINLHVKQQSQLAIENAIETLRNISKIETDSVTEIGKANELLNQLQNRIKTATEAANILSSVLSENNTTCDIIFQILNKQQTAKYQIGEDGNPTESQITHWQRHGILCEDPKCKKNINGDLPHSHQSLWSDPSCPHCKAEGRFEPGYNREDTRSLKGLTEYEALRQGLISRGFTQSKNNPEIWNKKNMMAIFLKPNGKVLNSKFIEWSQTHRSALIADGKIHAGRFGFNKQLPNLKRNGCVVKTQKKLIQETQVEKLTRKIGKLNF